MTAGDGFDRLVRDWTGHAERWARYQERRYPGEDWWPTAGRALWKAAATFAPDAGASFIRWLHVNLRSEAAGDLRRWRRRRARRKAAQDALTQRYGRGAGDEPRIDAGRLAAVLAALDALPEREATPIRRRYLRGEPIRAIARSRMVRAGTVAEDIRRGLATLRDELSGA